MSKISKEGYEQIRIIRNALDSMYDKLDTELFVPKVKTTKNIDGDYNKINVFEKVKEEFETIATIVEESGKWEEVK